MSNFVGTIIMENDSNILRKDITCFGNKNESIAYCDNAYKSKRNNMMIIRNTYDWTQLEGIWKFGENIVKNNS